MVGAAAPPQHPVFISGLHRLHPRCRAHDAGHRGDCLLARSFCLGSISTMSDEIWARIDDPHPQSGLKALLTKLELERAQIRFNGPPIANDQPEAQL